MGGGVRSITVGVQFLRHPSRQAKGGGKPESVRQNRLVSDHSPSRAHETCTFAYRRIFLLYTMFIM